MDRGSPTNPITAATIRVLRGFPGAVLVRCGCGKPAKVTDHTGEGFCGRCWSVARMTLMRLRQELGRVEQHAKADRKVEPAQGEMFG